MFTWIQNSRLIAAMRGRIFYLLLVVTVLNFGYPLTLYMGPAGNLVFIAFYGLMFVVGVAVTSEDHKHFVRTSNGVIFWVLVWVLYTIFPASKALQITSLLSLIPCQLLILSALMRFIYKAPVIDMNVLLASVTIYILLAALFSPLYNTIEALSPGSFVDNSLGQPVQWQQILYFSFVTITTTGYGDILPINPWARSLATLEAMCGVLYVALLMGRLVGIYSQERVR